LRIIAEAIQKGTLPQQRISDWVVFQDWPNFLASEVRNSPRGDTRTVIEDQKAFRPRFATWAGYFSQRAKSNQKRLWVGLGDLPFGSPPMLGSSGGRSTRSAQTHAPSNPLDPALLGCVDGGEFIDVLILWVSGPDRPKRFCLYRSLLSTRVERASRCSVSRWLCISPGRRREAQGQAEKGPQHVWPERA